MHSPTHHHRRALRRLLHASALCLGMAAAHAGWTPIAPMDEARAQHTATLLGGSTVLVAGGDTGNMDGGNNPIALASTRLYNPATNTWSNGPDLPSPRFGHTATALPGGTVLLVGGRATGPVNSADANTLLYDPLANTFATSAGQLALRRSHHTATLLPDGTVLVVGGRGIAGQEALSSVEIFDPGTGTWSSGMDLPARRREHTATLLPDGRVLVVGGYDNGNTATQGAYLRDPATGAWTEVPTPALNTFYRAQHTATLLPDGRVLVAGGNAIVTTTLVFNPADNTWAAGPNLPAFEFGGHTATRLPGAPGNVLVAGGNTGANASAVTSTVSPASGAGQAIRQPDLITARLGHTATLLAGGQVLALGGYTELGNGSPTSTGELYTHTAPLPPANVTAQPGNAQVTVRWQAPAGNGTTPALFTVTAQPGGRTCTASYPATSCTVAGLANGTPYTFTVVATALGGIDSAPSAPPAAATPSAAAPGGPGNAQGVPTLSQWGVLLLAALMLWAGTRRRAVSA
jgi:N-acetylneuraminic acid mutarotase